MQNMLKYLMRLRLHVSELVPLSDPRMKTKASERQGKARHLLYLERLWRKWFLFYSLKLELFMWNML
jgi:hypothetical protein